MCRGSGCRSIHKGYSQQSTFSNGGIPSVSHHLSGERSFPLFCYPETAGVQVWLPGFDKKLSENAVFNLLPSYPTLCHPLSLWDLWSAFLDMNSSYLLGGGRWEGGMGFNMMCAHLLEPLLHVSPLFSMGLCTFQVLRLIQDFCKLLLCLQHSS